MLNQFPETNHHMRNFTNLLKILSLTAAVIGLSAPSSAREVSRPQSYYNFFPGIAEARDQTPAGDIPAGVMPAAKIARRATATEGSPVYGYLYYSPSGRESGFYNITPENGNSTLCWRDFYTDWGMVMTNGWLRDGRICGMNSYSFMGGIFSYNYVEFDFSTGETLRMTPLSIDNNDLRNVYVTAAYRDLDDRIYGYGYSNDGESMGFNSAPSTDIDSSVTIKTTPYEKVCIALCYNVQDDLFYGVTTEGIFVSVDSEGKQTELFDLAIRNLRDAVTGIVYNPTEGTYTLNVFLTTNRSAMYSIDPVAKTAIKIADCKNNEEYIFMVNTLPNAAPGAPARPIIGGLSFDGASTAGILTGSLPSHSQDGEPLSGTLVWELYIDGVLTDSGTGAPESALTASISGISRGNHVFALMASKDGKRSVPAIRKQWVGADQPLPPAEVELADGRISWTAVTEGVHEGYVDLSDIRYTVRLNDKNLGTTSGTTIEFSFPEGQPYQTYHAYVTASSGGIESEAGVSNPMNHGEALKINPSIHFRPEEWELPLFTTLNVDGRKDSEGNDLTWVYTEEMAFPSFASGYNGDDWLFFPPMEFDTAEKAYQFVMEAGLVHDSDTRGRISVYLGKEPTPEAMTLTILPPHQCEHMRGDDIKELFSVTEPGVYYIGIHAVTYNVSFHISDMDIAITETPADVPVTVSDLSAKAAPDGKLSAMVTFRMPETTSNGNPIPQDAKLEATVSAYPRTIGSTEHGDLVEAVTISGAPGSMQTVEVKTAQNDNLITVACALNGRYGAESSITLYTGVVRPYVVQDLKAEVTEDNMGMKLTWNPPVEGEEEGAIGDSFYYTVWYYNNSWEFGDYVGWDIREYTYRLNPGAEQQWVRLGIMALNDAGQSYHVQGVTEVIGTPYTLPIVETFPDYYEEYEPIMVLRPTPEYDNTFWYVDDPADILAPEFACKSGVAYIGFVDSETAGAPVKNAKSRLSLPKFSTKGLEGVTFTLEYFGGLGGKYAAGFHVLADAYGIEPTNVGDLPKGEGWLSRTVVLPEQFNDRAWVELLLDADYADDQEFAMFTAYSVSVDSGVDTPLFEETDGRIVVTPGMVHISGFQGQSLLITDLEGRVIVSRSSLDTQNGYALAPGLYIVKAGSTTRKIKL